MERNVLPPYTPSAPSPRYSNGLLPGEQIIVSTRRVSPRPPIGRYRRITDRLTIVLRDQHPGNVYPIYDRAEAIHGDVILGNTGDLTSVVLKLEGQFRARASEVPVSSTFLSATHVLWSASHAQCRPQTIPFWVVFPRTFDDGGQARALPPTFENSELRAACSYVLTIELSRPRQFLSLVKGREGVKVPLIYRPRNRPHLPMLPSNLPFMSTVKSSPEEWHQVLCTVPMSQSSGLAPIECLLFIPSVQIYALSDTIPFHLQICGCPTSLLPFLEPGQGVAGQRDRGVAVRVYLLRQTIVRLHGQTVIASRNLGEGKIELRQSLSSRQHVSPRYAQGEGLDALDLDGELKCSEDVTIPSFFTNQVCVKDSVVLSITPREPFESPLLGVTHYTPIRLATDPWPSDVAPVRS